MPHHTFWWEGIDGTRVFTHFPPADTYNSDLSGRELARAERKYAEKGAADLSLLPFGYGDGGGGPTREMIAAAHRTRSTWRARRRVRDRHARATSSPRAEAEYADAAGLAGRDVPGAAPRHLHQPAQTKQGNRRNEHLLREAEL